MSRSLIAASNLLKNALLPVAARITTAGVDHISDHIGTKGFKAHFEHGLPQQIKLLFGNFFEAIFVCQFYG